MRRAIEASLATHQTEQAERDAIAESLASSAPPPLARSASAPARLVEKNDDDDDAAAEDEPVIAESPFARRVRLAEAAVEAREAVEAEEAAVAAAEAEAAVPPVEWTFVAPGPDAVARTPSQDPIAWAEAAAELAEDEGADDRRVAAAMALAARVGGGRWRPASVDVRVRTPRADAGAMLVDAAVASAPSRLSGCAVQ